MATIFVSKLGNDSNDGLSLAYAKKTIGAAIAAASDGDTVEIHSGHYNENLGTVSAVNSLTLTGVGQVVVDGNGTITRALSTTGTLQPNQTFNNLEFRNHTDANVQITSGTSNAPPGWVFNNCRFFMTVGSKKNISDLTASNWFITFNRCLFVNKAAGGENYRGVRNDPTFERCTFETEDGSCYVHGDVNAKTSIIGCLFITNTGRCIDLVNDNTTVLNVSEFNFFQVRGAGHVGRRLNIDQTTLANWQTGGTDGNSQEGDPLILDRVLEIYIPDILAPSPLIETGKPVGTGLTDDVGAFAAGFALSPNVNSSIWDDSVLVNVIQNPSTGFYELDLGAAEGSVASGVLDLGADFKLAELRLFGFENPLNESTVFDFTLGDDDVTLEFRGSDTVFLKDAGAPAFVEFIRNEVTDLTVRFIQFRVTLRNNTDLV